MSKSPKSNTAATDKKDVAVEPKERTLSDDVKSMAQSLMDKIKINEDNSVDVDQDAFESTLPEELKAHVEPIQRHIATFNTALASAAGEVVIPMMKEKSVKEAKMLTKVGLGSTGITFTAPSGKCQDGTDKPISVRVVSRQYEHPDFDIVKKAIINNYKKLSD